MSVLVELRLLLSRLAVAGFFATLRLARFRQGVFLLVLHLRPLHRREQTASRQIAIRVRHLRLRYLLSRACKDHGMCQKDLVSLREHRPQPSDAIRPAPTGHGVIRTAVLPSCAAPARGTYRGRRVTGASAATFAFASQEYCGKRAGTGGNTPPPPSSTSTTTTTQTLPPAADWSLFYKSSTSYAIGCGCVSSAQALATPTRDRCVMTTPWSVLGRCAVM